jgi:hypothetical protein
MPDAWHHIVAQASTTTTLAIFFDGVKNDAINTGASGALAPCDFSLGAPAAGAPTIGPDARLAELALYDHVVTPVRVTAHYLAGKVAP